MQRLLLTGCSGFLGGILLNTLKEEFLIDSLGRGAPNDIICDLSKNKPELNYPYDVILHAAGKAHFAPKTAAAGRLFFDVNAKGTANLLQGLEKSLPQSFIFISSVAVYGLKTGTLIMENHPLLAKDPYGKSKIDAEKLVCDWCEKNGVICTILRLPLVAGPNPPGNLKTMIKSIRNGYYFNIAGGKTKKSVVLAEDVAKIIPVAANVGGIYNLTDGYHPSFLELSEIIAQQLNKPKPLDIPFWMPVLLGKTGDLLGSQAINSKKLLKITSHLTFDDSKAQNLLGWKPTPVLSGFKIV